MDIDLVRTLTGVAAADDAAREYLRKWPVGQERRADVRRPRDYKTLKRWMGFARLLYESGVQDASGQAFKSEKAAHYYLKLLAGHATPVVSRTTGEVRWVPDSIDYDSLEEDEFQAVWKRAIQGVIEELLPAVTEAQLEREILQFCGLRSANA
jgi:hypothetical protein